MKSDLMDALGPVEGAAILRRPSFVSAAGGWGLARHI